MKERNIVLFSKKKKKGGDFLFRQKKRGFVEHQSVTAISFPAGPSMASGAAVWSFTFSGKRGGGPWYLSVGRTHVLRRMAEKGSRRITCIQIWDRKVLVCHKGRVQRVDHRKSDADRQEEKKKKLSTKRGGKKGSSINCSMQKEEGGNGYSNRRKKGASLHIEVRGERVHPHLSARMS